MGIHRHLFGGALGERVILGRRIVDYTKIFHKFFLDGQWVRNPLRPRGEEVPSTGLGLQNIVNRYALLCEQPVWAGEQEGYFVVRIPLLY